MSHNSYGIHLRRWALSLPPVETAVSYVRDLLIRSLQCGPIPQHIAFVMDGNRRYARDHALETIEGHNLGFESLARILEVCYKSGVQTVTIYAFSIENFKRSKWEVDALMDMAKTKLVAMCGHGELLERYGARVRILGDRSLIREDVLKQVDRAVEMTRGNGKAVLNVCFPYTSREEITQSVRKTVVQYSEPLQPGDRPREKKKMFCENHIRRNIQSQQLESVLEEDDRSTRSSRRDHRDEETAPSDGDSVSTNSDLDASTLLGETPSSRTSHSTSPILKATPSNNLPDPESITAEVLTNNMYTEDAPPLDLLIRTSGVCRLSDFMLWQCHENTELRFLDVLWPQFDLWHFVPVLLDWQRKQRKDGEVSARIAGRTGVKVQ